MPIDDMILVFGGESGERRVSVASAQNMLQQVGSCRCWFWNPEGLLFEITAQELLEHQNVFESDFIPINSSPLGSLEEALSNVLQKDVLFLALHGGTSEDGTLQEKLESRNIAFTGSGALASGRAFDKSIAKEVAFGANLRVPRSIMARGDHLEDAEHRIRELLRLVKQVVIKPVADGSSIGVHFVSDEPSLRKALAELEQSPTSPYLVEERIIGRELTVGVLEAPSGLRPLPCSEVLLNTGREFDFAGKYLGDGVQEITPADIDEETATAAQEMASLMHEALECSGYSRTDIMVDSDGVVFIETNTLPGLSSASFIPQQLEAANIETREFIIVQLNLARTRRNLRTG